MADETQNTDAADARFPQLRTDPFTGRTTIVAPDRQNRPHSNDTTSQATDPFLEGNEHETPPEVMVVREPRSQPNGPGWTIRIVPNRFAALANFDATQNTGSQTAEGVHEVVIECPHSETCISQFSTPHIERLFQVYRDRLKELAADERLAAAILFKNKGTAAGASLSHAHSQIIATQFVPDGITNELTRCQAIHERDDIDPFEKLINDARATNCIVTESAEMVTLCPFASRFPFEAWVMPKSPASRFESSTNAIVNPAGQMMRDLIQRLRKIHGDPPYNFVLHSLPFHKNEVPWYRWHFELYPRLAGFAGYEAGADCFINTIPAEIAAEQLRNAVTKPC